VQNRRDDDTSPNEIAHLVDGLATTVAAWAQPGAAGRFDVVAQLAGELDEARRLARAGDVLTASARNDRNRKSRQATCAHI
jgi:hypothetical protein